MRRLLIRKQEFSQWRIHTLILFFLFLFLLVEFRLFFTQVIDHKKYTTMAENQYWNVQELSARRGDILSSDGQVIAGTKFNYLMYGEPNKITDKYKTAHTLAETLAKLRNKSFDDYYNKFFDLLNHDLMWIALEKNITPVEKTEFEKLKLEGLGFEEEPVRYYPDSSLASAVLGFVAFDNEGNKQGYFGIEGKLNEDLKGRPGRVIQEIDATGKPILAGGYKKIDPVQGRNIVLTIDRAVQYIAEKKIKDGVEKYNAVSGSILIMDPLTGDVYAMANYPTYDPGNLAVDETELEGKDLDRKKVEKRNLNVSQTYEPGSVMKPLTIATAIELGLVSPQTTYEDNGPVWYSNYKIDNWDGKHYGTMNIIQLLQKSNNIGAAWVGHKIGAQKLYEYLRNFGIGSKTNIELEGEDSGILNNYTGWYDIDLATISFGQGDSATPLQVLNAFNALANGGYILEPKIISKLIDEKESEIPTRIVRRVISENTSKTMVDLLESAASGGEAQFFVLKNYRIAGKTGTAQIPEGGKYNPNDTNCTFVGFMAGSRKFSMIIKLEKPRSSIYAAETAVPLWMETSQELVKYFGLPPDRVSK